MAKKYTARVGQLEKVYRAILDNPGITTKRLADRVQLAYSPHFRGLVRELYDQKVIYGEAFTLPNGFPEYRWWVAENAPQN